jgi:hypothetical protein
MRNPHIRLPARDEQRPKRTRAQFLHPHRKTLASSIHGFRSWCIKRPAYCYSAAVLTIRGKTWGTEICVRATDRVVRTRFQPQRPATPLRVPNCSAPVGCKQPNLIETTYNSRVVWTPVRARTNPEEYACIAVNGLRAGWMH